MVVSMLSKIVSIFLVGESTYPVALNHVTLLQFPTNYPHAKNGRLVEQGVTIFTIHRVSGVHKLYIYS